jgi:type VII secretion integral membrane protein EccD
MSETSLGEVCRLAVVGPTSRVDLSVPVHVPVTDLMPALLRSLGTDLADRGLEHSGWVLQRLGEPPFDEDSTTQDLGLADGDVVHLRPRSEQIPPLDFDDLVDGIATGIGLRSGLWRSSTTRFVSLCALALWIAVALVVPALPGVPSVQRVLLAGACSLIMLGGTILVVRVLRDPQSGALFAAGAVGFAVEAALIGGSGLSPAGAAGADSLLLAAGAGSLVSLVAVLLVTGRSGAGPGLVTALVAALGAAIGAGLRLAGLPWDETATAVLLITVALRPTVPLWAFKLAGMALPPLPVEPDDLQKDIEPEPGKEVLDRAAAVDRQMTALCLAYGAISGVALVVMGLSDRPLVLITGGCVAASQLLAVRPMTSTWHRLALGLPAVAGMATGMIDIAGRVGTDGRAIVLAVGLVLVVSAGTAAHTLPRRRLTPLWGRAGDWAQTLGVVVAMGTALGVWGLFGLIRRTVG